MYPPAFDCDRRDGVPGDSIHAVEQSQLIYGLDLVDV